MYIKLEIESKEFKLYMSNPMEGQAKYDFFLLFGRAESSEDDQTGEKSNKWERQFLDHRNNK